MDKTKLCDIPIAGLPEDLLAYAAGYLQLVTGHHDSLVARIERHSASPDAEHAAVVGALQRQLHIQAAVVDSAAAIVEELVLCDGARGPTWDKAKIDHHRLQLLDEIRGLADRSVPA